MKKSVNLKITSTQYIENLKPSGEAFRRELELEDSMEILTEGTVYSHNNATYITYEEAKEKLIMIKGVGDKVANCVLLFGLGYTSAFPVDVWIKRIMEHIYFHKDTPKEKILEFAKEKYGKYGGYAQQYLFYFARDGKIN